MSHVADSSLEANLHARVRGGKERSPPMREGCQTSFGSFRRQVTAHRVASSPTVQLLSCLDDLLSSGEDCVASERGELAAARRRLRRHPPGRLLAASPLTAALRERERSCKRRPRTLRTQLSGVLEYDAFS